MFRQPCLRSSGHFLLLSLLCLSLASAFASGTVQQNRPAQSADPQLRLLQFYSRYPERYLRISRESWKYEKKSQTAFHSFTLINTAAVRYRNIQVRISYQTPEGKVVNEQTLKIPGVIGPSTTLQLDQMRVKGVPTAAEAAVLSVISAVPQP
jgi:hypothetical protein